MTTSASATTAQAQPGEPHQRAGRRQQDERAAEIGLERDQDGGQRDDAGDHQSSRQRSRS